MMETITTTAGSYLVPAVLLILSPIIGGLLIGLDRKITARLQNRRGPPIIQPFYDFLKLLGKEDKIVNKSYLVFGVAYLSTVILSTALLLFEYDLLVIVFMFGLSFIFLVLAGYSVRSQFSFVGATRELMQMLTYEPVLLLIAFMIRLVTGSFEVDAITKAGQPLLYTLPLALVALFVILPIKFRKSPFDISTAHSEIAQGPMIEFSGKYLALVEASHFFEMFFILWFVGLFYVQSWPIRILLMAVAYIFVIVVDNITARLRVDQMIKQVYIVAMILLLINLAYIIFTGSWVV
jgi:ech hydrogenase subunit B